MNSPLYKAKLISSIFSVPSIPPPLPQQLALEGPSTTTPTEEGSEQPEGASWPFPTIPSQLGNFASAPLRFPEKMVTKQK